MPTRNEVLEGLSIQADLIDDLGTALTRARTQRDIEIFQALQMGIGERPVAAAARLSRSYVNKVRRLNGRAIA